MTTLRHAARIGLLMAGAAALLGWVLRHTEATFADGLRYIHRAEQIERGAWGDGVLKGIDHPLHPLGIVAAHRVLGGADPASWQRAALALCFASAVLLVVPVYLLALELFDDQTAWLACILVIVNPIIAYIVVNVLEREHLPALVDFRLVGSSPVLERRAVPLAAAGDRIWGAGLPDPSGGDAPTRGDRADPPPAAHAPRDPNQLATLVARLGVPGGGLGAPGRPLHRH